MAENRTAGQRWFRFYAEALNDPKIQRLQPHLFKTWINLLCLACASGGVLPHRDEISFALRLGDHEAGLQLDELISLGLIDIRSDGTHEPHNWRGRQYVSDSSTDRVRDHRRRKRSRNVSGNHGETPPESESRSKQKTESCRPMGAEALRVRPLRPDVLEAIFAWLRDAMPGVDERRHAAWLRRQVEQHGVNVVVTAWERCRGPIEAGNVRANAVHSYIERAVDELALAAPRGRA